MSKRISYHSRTIAVLLLSMLLAGCGGGGGSDSAETPEDDIADQENLANQDNQDNQDNQVDGSMDLQDMQGNEPDRSDEQDTDSQDPDKLEDSADPEKQQNDPSAGTALPSGAVASLAWKSGMSSADPDPLTTADIDLPRFTTSGQFAFKSSLELSRPGVRTDHIFAGPLGLPRSILTEGSEIESLRSGFIFESLDFGGKSLAIASDGSVAAIIRTHRASDGTRSTALTRIDADSARSLIEPGGSITTFAGAARLTAIDSVSISSDAVAFVGDVRLANDRRTGLYLQEGDSFKAILEGRSDSGDATPMIGDCALYLSNKNDVKYRLLDSGALIFTAAIDGGRVGSPCTRTHSAVIEYMNGTYTVIAREDEPVPGSDAFLFRSIGLVSIRDDGSVQVNATVQDRTRGFAQSDIVSRASGWLFRKNEDPALIYMEGESFERPDGNRQLNLGNIDRTRGFSTDIVLSVQREYAALLIQEKDLTFGEDRSLLFSGKVHEAQPHASLDTPGGSALDFQLELYSNEEFPGTSLSVQADDSQSESGFDDSDRIRNISAMTTDSTGNLYLYACVVSTMSPNGRDPHIIRKSSDGSVMTIAGPLDRMDVQGQQRLIFSDVLNHTCSQSDLTNEFLGNSVKRLITMDDDSILAWNNTGGAVLLQLP